ncbi:MAG: DUF167 family protein [Hyphomicrobiaceae bacterium]
MRFAGASAADVPWRIVAAGLAVRVRVTPKASRDAIEGIELTGDGPALKARVRAVPEGGAANAAIEALLANWLGVGRRCVALTAGAKSRVKTLTVDGAGPTLAVVAAERLAENQKRKPGGTEGGDA